MDALLQYQAWTGWLVGLVATALVVRQLLVVLAAEQGRKHDLVKKRYKQAQEFQVSVLIPFLDADEHPALLTLLQALADQDYPASKVSVHLVTTEITQHELIPQSLRPNVKTWQYPAAHPRYEHALGWLIERCLAAGGNGLFVFLKPTDVVKPDFFQNIVARGLDSFAVQGYVALKNPPETPIERMVALSTRLFNRIGNAGVYHMGMSCRLLDSGWAIKQEVLEMIPYHRGLDLDNLEYTLRLNLENFRVTWAPTAVVYTDARVPFLEHTTRCVGTLFNRLRLMTQYGPRLLSRLLLRFDFNSLEQLLSVLRPPILLVFILALGLAAVSAAARPITADVSSPASGLGLDNALLWAALALVALSLNVLGLVVARSKAGDYLTLLVHTPLAYLMTLLASPIGLFNMVNDVLSKQHRRGNRYRRVQATRFNEDMAPARNLFDEQESGQDVIRNILKKNAPSELDFDFEPAAASRGGGRRRQRPSAHKQESHGSSPDASADEVTRGQAVTAPRMKLPRETVKSVPLSNGKKQVDCLLKTRTTFDETDQEHYKLTLEYKSVAFSTASYRILDQAFYELHAKLMGRGLRIITCGSCGNFYNPTADVPGALKNSGVCLFGKTGRDVNLQTDAVTVISPACAYHCPLEQRETIVRQWKDSLSYSSPS